MSFSKGVCCVVATVLLATAGFTAMAPGPRPVVGARARGELASRARRPRSDFARVPTPADPATEPQTIRIVVETTGETAPAPRKIAPKTLSIVVYTATWCVPCKQLAPAIAAARARGYVVEVRDTDAKPTGDAGRIDVPAVPAVFLYENGVYTDKASGVAACLTMLEKLHDYDD